MVYVAGIVALGVLSLALGGWVDVALLVDRQWDVIRHEIHEMRFANPMSSVIKYYEKVSFRGSV